MRASPQDLDSTGEHRVSEKMRRTGELQVKILRENAVLLVCGSAEQPDTICVQPAAV